jgi:hypothetical protein
MKKKNYIFKLYKKRVNVVIVDVVVQKEEKPFKALAPYEKEIDFKYYKSTNDKYVLKLETNQNVFTFITLIEFINMLEIFLQKQQHYLLNSF